MLKNQQKYENTSSPLIPYKNQTRITPTKQNPPMNIQYQKSFKSINKLKKFLIDSITNATLATTRSSVSGSTASHYNSINATLQKQIENSSSSYNNKYNNSNLNFIKPVTNFDPQQLQDRGRSLPNKNAIIRTPSATSNNGLIQNPSSNESFTNSNTINNNNYSSSNNYIQQQGQQQETQISQNKLFLLPQNIRTRTSANEHSTSPYQDKSIVMDYKQSPLNVNVYQAQPLVVSNIKQRQQTKRDTEQDLNASVCDSSNCCINHPTKKGKYRIPQDQSVSLCSKCAVTMVGQGFRVEEIIESYNASDIRKREIEKFLDSVAQQIPNMEKVLSALTIKKDEIRKYYDQQIQKIQFYFNQINELIEQSRLELEQNLQNNFRQVSQLYEDNLCEMQHQVSEAGNMQKDIELNVNRIIQQIELEPFREIMSSYRGNLDKFIQKITEVQRQPVDVIKVEIPLIDEQIPKFKQYIQSITNEIQVVLVKTSLVKKSNPDIQTKINTQESIQNPNLRNGNLNGSLYVSFENKEQFSNNIRQLSKKSPTQINKSTSGLICKTPEDQKQQNSIRISPNSVTSKQAFNTVRVATVQLYDQKEEDRKPFRNLFNDGETVKQNTTITKTQQIPKDAKIKDMIMQESSASFEEGHSQMIEKEDIENTYNLMLCDNESEQEELQQHIIEMNKFKNRQKQSQQGIQLFCSPQFKDH